MQRAQGRDLFQGGVVQADCSMLRAWSTTADVRSIMMLVILFSVGRSKLPFVPWRLLRL